MKLTKTQLKQILKEVFSSDMTESQLIAQNRLDINDLYAETRRLRAEFQDSLAELEFKFNDYISTGERPKEFPDVVPGKANISIDTNAGGMPTSSEYEEEIDEDFLPMFEGRIKLTKLQLKQIIKEELENEIKYNRKSKRRR